MLRNMLKSMRNFNTHSILHGARIALYKKLSAVSTNIVDIRQKLKDMTTTNRMLVLMHYHSGYYNDAIMRLRLIKLMWGNSPFVHYNLSRCYLAKNNTPKALECIDMALELDPRDEMARYQLQKIKYPAGVGFVPPAIAMEHCSHHFTSFLKATEEEIAIYIDMINTIKRVISNFVVADIMDIGCGAGLLGKHLQDLYMGRNLIGVDICHKAVHHCTHLTHNGIRVYSEVMEREMHAALASRKECLDVIATYRTLEMFGDLSVFMPLCLRALRKSGVLAFITQRTRCSHHMQFAPSIDRFFYSEAYIEDIARKTGFDIVEKKYFNLKAGDNLVEYILRKS